MQTTEGKILCNLLTMEVHHKDPPSLEHLFQYPTIVPPSLPQPSRVPLTLRASSRYHRKHLPALPLFHESNQTTAKASRAEIN